MQIVCPNCSAQYDVAEGAIPAQGREVQCTNCAHVWMASPEGVSEPIPEQQEVADQPLETTGVFRSTRSAFVEPETVATAPIATSEPAPKPQTGATDQVKEILRSEAAFSSQTTTNETASAAAVEEPAPSGFDDLSAAIAAATATDAVPSATPAPESNAAAPEPAPAVPVDPIDPAPQETPPAKSSLGNLSAAIAAADAAVVSQTPSTPAQEQEAAPVVAPQISETEAALQEAQAAHEVRAQLDRAVPSPRPEEATPPQNTVVPDAAALRQPVETAAAAEQSADPVPPLRKPAEVAAAAAAATPPPFRKLTPEPAPQPTTTTAEPAQQAAPANPFKRAEEFQTLSPADANTVETASPPQAVPQETPQDTSGGLGEEPGVLPQISLPNTKDVGSIRRAGLTASPLEDPKIQPRFQKFTPQALNKILPDAQSAAAPAPTAADEQFARAAAAPEPAKNPSSLETMGLKPARNISRPAPRAMAQPPLATDAAEPAPGKNKTLRTKSGRAVFADVDTLGSALEEGAEKEAKRVIAEQLEAESEANETSKKKSKSNSARRKPQFWTGFWAACALVVAGAAVYIFAEPMSRTMPFLADPLASYSGAVNNMRVLLQNLYAQGGDPSLGNFASNAMNYLRQTFMGS